MNWQAKIKTKEDQGTTIKVTFVFVDLDVPDMVPIEITDKSFTSDDQIKRYAFSQIEAYKNKSAITIQQDSTLDLSDLTPKAPTPPTPEQIAAQKYNSKRQELITAFKDRQMGAKTDDEYNIILQELIALKP